MTHQDQIFEDSNHHTNVQDLFTYMKKDEITEDRIITSCTLNMENVKTVSAEDIFKVNSYWKDRDLLYSTVKTYAALTGWKPTLTHKIYI